MAVAVVVVVRGDANAAFKYTDTPAVAKKMVMASASADLDNDWKDEVVTLFGYEGGALHASFTWVGADGEPTTAVVRELAVGGSASAVVYGATTTDSEMFRLNPMEGSPNAW